MYFSTSIALGVTLLPLVFLFALPLLDLSDIFFRGKRSSPLSDEPPLLAKRTYAPPLEISGSASSSSSSDRKSKKKLDASALLGRSQLILATNPPAFYFFSKQSRKGVYKALRYFSKVAVVEQYPALVQAKVDQLNFARRLKKKKSLRKVYGRITKLAKIKVARYRPFRRLFRRSYRRGLRRRRSFRRYGR